MSNRSRRTGMQINYVVSAIFKEILSPFLSDLIPSSLIDGSRIYQNSSSQKQSHEASKVTVFWYKCRTHPSLNLLFNYFWRVWELNLSVLQELNSPAWQIITLVPITPLLNIYHFNLVIKFTSLRQIHFCSPIEFQTIGNNVSINQGNHLATSWILIFCSHRYRWLS